MKRRSVPKPSAGPAGIRRGRLPAAGRAAALALLFAPAAVPAQEPAFAPAPAAAAERAEARRAETLEEVARLAAELHGRTVCALFPANRRGLPAFKADTRGDLSLELTVQCDLAAYRAWVSELSSKLRRLARETETVRLSKEPAGYRFALPDREIDASQFAVVDGFSEIPAALSATVYSFDLATAAAVREAFRPPREKADQTAVVVQFRDDARALGSVRLPFSVVSGAECVAPFVESRVRYQRFGKGARAATCPVLSFRSRRSLRLSVPRDKAESLREMTVAWSACLSNAAADALDAGAAPAAPLRDFRGRAVDAGPFPGAGRSGSRHPGATVRDEPSETGRATASLALRQRAEAATAEAVLESAKRQFDSVRGGSRGKEAAAAVSGFEPEDLSTACVSAEGEGGDPDGPLRLAGEAYLSSQLWARWRMRAVRGPAGEIVPSEPVWSLVASFQPPEFVRGAARVNPFPALSLEDPGAQPAPEPVRSSVSFRFALLALAGVLLLAGTVALLWIEILRARAEREARNGDDG